MLLAVNSLNEDAVNKHMQIIHKLQNSKTITEWGREGSGAGCRNCSVSVR